jgi:hypothetical protein
VFTARYGLIPYIKQIYNRGGKCLQRGTDWFLTLSRLRLVFKMLMRTRNPLIEVWSWHSRPSWVEVKNAVLLLHLSAVRVWTAHKVSLHSVTIWLKRSKTNGIFINKWRRDEWIYSDGMLLNTLMVTARYTGWRRSVLSLQETGYVLGVK